MTLIEMKKAIEIKATTLNAMSDAKAVDIAKAKADIENDIKAWNADSMNGVFKGLLELDNPVLSAIKMLTYPVISLKASQDKDTMIMSYSIASGEKQISLVKLCEQAKANITNSPDWNFRVEKFGLLATYRAANELRKDASKLLKTIYISKVAKEIEMGKTPTSNTQMLKQLQFVIDGIIFIPDENGNNTVKATSHDVSYFYLTMCKRIGSATVAFPKVETSHTLVMDILHKIIMGKDYSLDFKVDEKLVKENEQAKENQAQEKQPEPKKAKAKKADADVAIPQPVAVEK